MAVPSEAFDLPTSGKVMLHTSLGDVCIELWAKECPVTCRNFLQHCVNQYFDGSPFHRVVKGFCVQTGDPTGTGTGGASTHHLGKAFKTETHARLRFKHRAMVAMAGEDGDNRSQFFITLREAPELNGKHALFGRVTPGTFFPLLSMEKLPVGPDDAPLEPPVIKTTTVIDNPFPDMVATAQPAAAKRSAPPPEAAKRAKKAKKAVKDVKVLSCADDGEDEEEGGNVSSTVVSTFLKGARVASAHDVISDEATLQRESAYTQERLSEIKSAHAAFDQKHGNVEDKRTARLAKKLREHAEDGEGSDSASEGSVEPQPAPITEEAQARIEALQEEQAKERDAIKKFNVPAGGEWSGEADSDKPKSNGRKWLEEQRAKFARRKAGAGREKETILKVISFQKDLKNAKPDSMAPPKTVPKEVVKEVLEKPAHFKAEGYSSEKPADADWFKTQITFVNPDAHLDGSLVDDTYEVLDPLSQAGATAGQRAAGRRIRSENHEHEQQGRARRIPDGFLPPDARNR